VAVGSPSKLRREEHSQRAYTHQLPTRLLQPDQRSTAFNTSTAASASALLMAAPTVDGPPPAPSTSLAPTVRGPPPAAVVLVPMQVMNAAGQVVGTVAVPVQLMTPPPLAVTAAEAAASLASDA